MISNRKLSRATASVGALLVACAPLSRGAEPARDPAAAEREYRVARRLAADGSPEAAAALARVVALDPTGPVADDALVDQARLEGLAGWPEELGRVSEEGVRRGLAPLERVLSALPSSDRAPEARLRAALARLEPLPGRDPARGRSELMALATAGEGTWHLAARLALGWLDEQDGSTERALGAYVRLTIDHPGSEAAARAGSGVGRVAMRRGEFGPAAAALQDSIDGAATPSAPLASMRDAAVRNLRRAAFPASRWPSVQPTRWSTGIKSATAMVALPDGDRLVADRRAGAIVRFDADGREKGRIAMDELEALAVDPFGRAWAAAGERVFVLRGNEPVAVASLGAFAPAGAIAVDAGGRIFLTDRRGDRIARVVPGGGAPELLRERRGASLAALAWSGGRLLALEERTGRVIDVKPDGTDQTVAATGASSTPAFAIDAAGQIAVLDAKSGAVLLLGPDGSPRDRLAVEAAGIGRVSALSFGPDGALDLLDSAGAATRIP